MLQILACEAVLQRSALRECTIEGRRSCFWRGILLAATLLAGSALQVNVARADQETEAEQQTGAVSIQALAAQWWEFVTSIPTSVNPLTDETGQYCMVGQRGNIWFLGGVLNASGNATRTCAIPEGKTLFFPVLNAIGVNTPNACGQNSVPLSLADLRAMNKMQIDSVTTKTATLDREPLNVRRETSKIFAITLPQDNLFSAPGSPCPAGVYSPVVDEGYYVKLSGLRAGSHVLEIKGSTPNFNLDVLYNLEIVPLKSE
ncbi:MAG: hypothetical protein JOZ42_00735 [Acetobacteraceae bacterium]|nr:hypothetical protein [Acetobacteraceae bacterium]